MNGSDVDVREDVRDILFGKVRTNHLCDAVIPP